MSIDAGHHTTEDARAGFRETRWSTVLAAGRQSTADAEAALARLCQAYWPPVYSFLRRRGNPPHEAEDLAQSFFADLLNRKGLRQVEPGRGRFRSFLLACVTHFLNNEHDRQQARKRRPPGGVFSLDAVDPEERARFEPADSATPDQAFERQWAEVQVAEVFRQLRDDYAAAGKAALFAELQPCITAEPRAGHFQDAAGRLGMSEGAVKVAMTRLRRRFGELLRLEVAQTVAQPEEIDDEIRHILGAIAT